MGLTRSFEAKQYKLWWALLSIHGDLLGPLWSCPRVVCEQVPTGVALGIWKKEYFGMWPLYYTSQWYEITMEGVSSSWAWASATFFRRQHDESIISYEKCSTPNCTVVAVVVLSSQRPFSSLKYSVLLIVDPTGSLTVERVKSLLCQASGMCVCPFSFCCRDLNILCCMFWNWWDIC